MASASVAQVSRGEGTGSRAVARAGRGNASGKGAVAQINVRLDAELKRAGDAELARLGISPSEIVRALWAKLARGDHQVRATVEQLVSQERTPERQAEVDRKLKALEEGQKIFLKFAEEMGLDPATHVPLTDKELEEERYQYFLEKYGA